MRLAALAAVVLALGGCEVSIDRTIAEGADALERYHDDERGVTCWGKQYYPDSISCLPDWMLTESRNKP